MPDMASMPAEPSPPAGPPASRGSRRRRLWELSSHALCPVVGVCLPIQVVRRVVDKALGSPTPASDYELHCGVNTACRQRCVVSEAIQRELDRRYASALRQSQPLKSPDALAQWWDAGLAGCEIAARFWAVLSHPRCDALLEERLLQDVHMLQHQNGVSARADLQRLEQLLEENQVLARELGSAQQRSTQLAHTEARQREHLQTQLIQLRAQLLGRDTLIAGLQEQVQQLQQQARALPARAALAERLQHSLAHNRRLQRELDAAEQALDQERERRRVAESRAAEHGTASQAPYNTPSNSPSNNPSNTALCTAASNPPHHAARDIAPAELGAPPLDKVAWADRAVLCVGGRTANVPQYRQWIERSGGRFLHHDGGDENNLQRLEHSLAAADLVICQTGCISHDAYWRVKEHCKRHGKRCVYLESPSTSSLRRALGSLSDSAPEPIDTAPLSGDA